MAVASGGVGGRSGRDSGRPRGSQEAIPGFPDSFKCPLQSLLSVNYVFPVNLTSSGLQPATPRRADASTSHPDDMGLSWSAAGPIQAA